MRDKVSDKTGLWIMWDDSGFADILESEVNLKYLTPRINLLLTEAAERIRQLSREDNDDNDN